MEWEVVQEYSDEGLSGTLSREKRSALNALIKDAYRKRFDSVVRAGRDHEAEVHDLHA
jgi:hypothetical protein